MTNEAVDKEVGCRVECEQSVSDGSDAFNDGVCIHLNERHELPHGDGDA